MLSLFEKKLGHQFIWRFCVHPFEGPGLGAVQLTELFRRAWAEKNLRWNLKYLSEHDDISPFKGTFGR